MKKLIDRGMEWIKRLELTKEEKRNLWSIGIITLILGGILWRSSHQPFSGILQRNTYGEGSRQEVLQVEIEGAEFYQEEVITIEVGEVQYTYEELQEVFQACTEMLDVLVLGENESADDVTTNLNLVTEVEGMGIAIAWAWEPYNLLNYDGEIQWDKVAEEGSIVVLQGTMTYGEQLVEYQKSVCIYPQTMGEEEQIIVALMGAIEEIQEGSGEESEFTLPTYLEGYDLTWYQEASYEWVMVLVLGAVMLVLLLLRKEEGQKQREALQREQLERDYPMVIHTLALYISAGMTVKNAWKRMVMEQEEKGQAGYIYQEMKRTYLQMSNGISETACYEEFGNRCGIRCCRRMGLLLSQNLRKGTKGLTTLLDQEAKEAFEMRKRRARQEGEEAGTKLLLPMFLMLSVVLVIVVIPAFLSIQV